MSQPKRPYEQIPYPTGSDTAPEHPAAEAPTQWQPAADAPTQWQPGAEAPTQRQPAADGPDQPQPSSLPPEWPDAPWAPDAPTVAQPPDSPWSQNAQGSPTGPADETAAPASAKTSNPWKWVAAGLAVLLAIVVAAVVGRATAPAPTTQAAPSQQAAADPDSPFTQGPLFTPDPQRSPDTFTPKPGSPPTFYSGRGNAAVTITKDPGPAIVQFVCDRCTGNTFLKSDGPESLLVNAIGGYSGRRPIDLQEGSATTTINVGATSDWRMTVSSGLGAARSGVDGAPLTGQGDDEVIMHGAAATAHVTNSGGAGFIVYVVPVQSATVNLAVNTTGVYDGTISLTSPAVVIVQSTGTWTITPS